MLPPAYRLPLDFDPVGLAADLAGIDQGAWIRHYNSAEYEGDWAALPLRSLAGSPTHIRPMPRAQILFEPTPILAACPHLAAAIGAFRCPVGSARLLRLGAGARILEHSNPYLAHPHGEMRLHIPVTTNPDVAFWLAGTRVEMRVGECWYVDVSLPHRVDNAGPTDRVHLVIDCAVDAWLSALLPPPPPPPPPS